MHIVENAGILVEDEKIVEVGSFLKLIRKHKEAEVFELELPSVAMPGMIDSHTHICFGGSRARDYAMRNSGSSYQEIAKAGGGIWDTVQHTRQQTDIHMNLAMLARAVQHRDAGITTIEVKSGYGLSVEEEIRMLSAIKLADMTCSADIIGTCLAAHIKPLDYDGDHAAYINEIIEKLFPKILSMDLCYRVDAFVEEGAFSPKIIAPYFERAKALDFDITVHADQFSPGGSAVAVEFGALSADHLEASGEREIQMLAESDTVATALPGASIGLGCDYTPARKLLDAGCCLAIASDWNPGSAPMGNLMTQAALLGAFEKLSNTEVLSGLTFRAAKALGLSDRGRLSPGMLADFIIFPTNDYREILYHQGTMVPYLVFKNGYLCEEESLGFDDEEFELNPDIDDDILFSDLSLDELAKILEEKTKGNDDTDSN